MEEKSESNCLVEIHWICFVSYEIPSECFFLHSILRGSNWIYFSFFYSFIEKGFFIFFPSFSFHFVSSHKDNLFWRKWGWKNKFKAHKISAFFIYFSGKACGKYFQTYVLNENERFLVQIAFKKILINVHDFIYLLRYKPNDFYQYIVNDRSKEKSSLTKFHTISHNFSI